MHNQDAGAADPLPLDEAAQRLKDEGGQLGGQLLRLWQILGELFRAELALSRSALLRIGLYTLLALMLAGSAWVCLLTALILGLYALGCPAWVAALLATLLLLGASLICALLARRLLPDLGFRHSRDALRQILTRAGLQQEPASKEHTTDEPS